MVANTLHISNKAKATAKTAPMTLAITAIAFISDGQSTMEIYATKVFLVTHKAYRE